MTGNAAIDSVLERVASVVAVVNAKADPADAAAYRQWLADISNVVISAARSGDFLGFGGQLVTKRRSTASTTAWCSHSGADARSRK
jgi:hypothetical protein